MQDISNLRTVCVLFLIVLVSWIPVHGQNTEKKPLEIIYIANAGFLIEYNSKKILIDALHSWPNFQSTPDEVFNDMRVAKPPFENIDLVLVTHPHPDHFHPDMVELFLANNSHSKFIAPPVAVELLKISAPESFEKFAEDQIITVDINLGEVVEISVKGIDLKIFGLDHGGPSQMINFAYLIKIDDKTLFHKGDSEVNDEFFESNNFSAEEIDILFAQEHSERLNKIIAHTKPKYIIYQHIRPMDFEQLSKTIRENHPDVIIFEKPMESRVFN